MRVKTFLLFWFASVAGILTYAFIDLHSNPQLSTERNFTLQPDFSQLPDAMHWGGRLLHHQAWTLLLGNALFVGGLIALVIGSLLQWYEKRQAKRSSGRNNLLNATKRSQSL